jgi:phospholipase D1/2
MFFLLQNQTMQMMYEIIAQELKSMNMEGVHPQDYLNFYCLGNCEDFSENHNIASDNQPEKSGPAVILNFSIQNI